MAKTKEHQDMTQAERERENREYIESQQPIVREEQPVLNPDGGNVTAREDGA